MKDVMVDLETLGNSPGAAILSIGAVAFDPETGEMDDAGFYTVVDVRSCVCASLRFDQDTLDWWKQQAPEARKVLEEAWSGRAPSLKNALVALNGYLRKHGADVRVWGNGSDFDNAILAVAYRLAGVTPGWKFWNSRCFRTLKNMSPGTTVQRVGTYHNALDDARTQAIHALRIFADIRVRGPSADFAGALRHLRDNQRQLDADGIEVGVSRQALDAILEATGASTVVVVVDLDDTGENVPKVDQLEDDLIG